ncbi:NIPSNAP family protein [Amycolatopsis sp. DSM 110486]|uniref:NIPSNAP family protein n=1 Tax=Amycolatopsis sp. DSM 110486 TaxID=2865832 RepID=UPI001C6A6163|nr:NIPSNAP family protein [Amycolatopsis sp. DSM 110486]QYN20816.1 NIPSNAP family protein [Amycolatopsis sp. DSM 110486]
MTGIPRSEVVDLRQYTLRPGRRDTLIDLFDSYFVDGQEDVGIHVVGQFRDLDDPDRFVWLRGFDSMAARGASLPAFYGGPVWQAHRDRANATMVDSDNALLLNPLRLADGYPRFGTARDSATQPRSVVGVTVVHRGRPIDEPFRAFVLDSVLPELVAAGGVPIAVFVTDPSVNNFPALPLREENVVVWINCFDDDAAYRAHHTRLAASAGWCEHVLPVLEHSAGLPMQQLRLRPTAGSHLR